jgi:hypothetical protein
MNYKQVDYTITPNSLQHERYHLLFQSFFLFRDDEDEYARV